MISINRSILDVSINPVRLNLNETLSPIELTSDAPRTSCTCRCRWFRSCAACSTRTRTGSSYARYVAWRPSSDRVPGSSAGCTGGVRFPLPVSRGVVPRPVTAGRFPAASGPPSDVVVPLPFARGTFAPPVLVPLVPLVCAAVPHSGAPSFALFAPRVPSGARLRVRWRGEQKKEKKSKFIIKREFKSWLVKIK